MQLVVFAGGNSWPAIQAISHWHRTDSPVERVQIHMSGDPAQAAASARGLERWIRELQPPGDVVVHETFDQPAAVQRFLEGLSGPAVIEASGLEPFGFLGLEPSLGRADTMVVRRNPAGAWARIRRAEDGTLESTSFGEISREATDGVSVPSLVRAHLGRGESRYRFAPAPAEAYPVAPLTEAVLAHGWRWAEAFESQGIGGMSGRSAEYFAKYIGAILRSLGLANVTLGGIESGTDGGTTGSGIAAVWVHHQGRLTLIDLGEVGSAEAPVAGERSWVPEISAAAERGRLLGALSLQTWLIRPSQRVSELERSLATAYGVRVLDERDCHDLPQNLAQAFGIPLNADLAEALRLLRVHLAESGRTRVFTEETWVVREQLAGGGDPVIADVDTWLNRIQVVRGQNWMLWTHRNRICVRVPAEKGRPETIEDWRLVLALVLGQVPEHINAVLRDNSVWLDLAEQAEVKRRASEWFRPFLNTQISFAAAQSRFAAEARVNTGAAPTAPQKPVRPPAPPLPTRPAPRKPVSNRPTDGGGPAKSGGSDGVRPPRATGLEDLDRALDEL